MSPRPASPEHPVHAHAHAMNHVLRPASHEPPASASPLAPRRAPIRRMPPPHAHTGVQRRRGSRPGGSRSPNHQPDPTLLASVLGEGGRDRGKHAHARPRLFAHAGPSARPRTIREASAAGAKRCSSRRVDWGPIRLRCTHPGSNNRRNRSIRWTISSPGTRNRP